MDHVKDMLVIMRCADVRQEGFEEEVVLPLARMVYGEVGQSYVVLARPEGANIVGKLTNVLKFTVKEIDPTTGVHVLLLCRDILRAADELVQPGHLVLGNVPLTVPLFTACTV